MSDLNQLAKDLFEARRAEDEAKKKRIAAEEAIAELVPTEGTGSKTVDAGGGLKVVVKRGMLYTADVDAIRGLNLEDAPVAFVPPQGASYAFDSKKYEEIREKNPRLFALISKHVTAKPSKTSVTLKLA